MPTSAISLSPSPSISPSPSLPVHSLTTSTTSLYPSPSLCVPFPLPFLSLSLPPNTPHGEKLEDGEKDGRRTHWNTVRKTEGGHTEAGHKDGRRTHWKTARKTEGGHTEGGHGEKDGRRTLGPARKADCRTRTRTLRLTDRAGVTDRTGAEGQTKGGQDGG